MSALPLSSDEQSCGRPVRQLRLLGGAAAAGTEAPTVLRPGAAPLSPVTGQAAPALAVVAAPTVSLSTHLEALAAAGTCWCCGDAMHAVGDGATTRCDACGAESEVVAAA
jgi:hypothetical protein